MALLLLVVLLPLPLPLLSLLHRTAYRGVVHRVRGRVRKISLHLSGVRRVQGSQRVTSPVGPILGVPGSLVLGVPQALCGKTNERTGLGPVLCGMRRA